MKETGTGPISRKNVIKKKKKGGNTSVKQLNT